MKTLIVWLLVLSVVAGGGYLVVQKYRTPSVLREAGPVAASSKTGQPATAVVATRDIKFAITAALIGKDVVLAHAKDLDHDGDAGHLAAGKGKLDYDRYVSLLHRQAFRGPLLLHGLSEAQVPGCVAFLRAKLMAVTAATSRK